MVSQGPTGSSYGVWRSRWTDRPVNSGKGGQVATGATVPHPNSPEDPSEGVVPPAQSVMEVLPLLFAGVSLQPPEDFEPYFEELAVTAQDVPSFGWSVVVASRTLGRGWVGTDSSSEGTTSVRPSGPRPVPDSPTSTVAPSPRCGPTVAPRVHSSPAPTLE